MNEAWYFVIFLLLGCTIGWCSNEIWEGYNNERNLNGLYIQNVNYEMAKNLSQNADKLGDWVCINTLNMEYREVVDTCVHEAAHEVFAEIIEKHPDKIEEVMKIIDENQS